MLPLLIISILRMEFYEALLIVNLFEQLVYRFTARNWFRLRSMDDGSESFVHIPFDGVDL